MTRIAVIGNAGGGKSTMCRHLSRALNIPSYSIDNIQWKPGWQRASDEEFQDKHEQILGQKTWIIDGFGTAEAMQRRFELADTLIFVDHPLYIHYWWAAKRQFACLFRERPDGPEGCPMLPMTRQMFQMIHHIHHHMRPQMLTMVEEFRKNKRVIDIRSPREMRAFMRQYGVPR